MIEEKQIIQLTYYGLYIYNYILSFYYPGQVVLRVAAKECKPAPNPWNENKLTLQIIRLDGMFCYFDTEHKQFTGNAFDFASLYFNLQGQELLSKINEVLYLELDETPAEECNKTDETLKDEPEWVFPQFSFFKSPITNILPYASITPLQLYHLIRGNRYVERTQFLRTLTKPLEARKYKAERFEYVCISGTFTKRGDAFLIQHSGLLVIDIDHIQNVEEVKERLLTDKFFKTVLLFCSPSGNGLKWIIEIDLNKCDHLMWFRSVSAYLEDVYHLTADKSGKDVSRACFLPYDPNIYINPKYL
jgi:hypothetical protein